MNYNRNLNYFHVRKIIYKRGVVNDKPTERFAWGSYYKDGTYECYTLFNSRAKISTFRALKWHLHVLWFLNPKMDPDEFLSMSKFICDIKNGFVTFTLSSFHFENIVYEVSMSDLEIPPSNKLRKVIFKDGCGLTTKEKLTLVGQVIGKKRLTESEIYDAMLMIHDNKEKITISKLADYLGCSSRTIHRNMGNELKKEKALLNN